MIDVLIIHYNTPELTAAAIQSLWKHTPEANVTVFDNSDRRPFVADGLNGRGKTVNVIDNTMGQIVDWEKWLAQFPDKIPCPENNWGSAKHTYSVELCFDMFPKGFFLMDSDVLIRKDITPMHSLSQAFVGEVCYCLQRNGFKALRVLPFLCWINTPMLRQRGIRYFNPDKAWKLTNVFPNCWYDTGASFFQETSDARLPYSKIDINDYILHFCNGSWKTKRDPLAWLEENRQLWDPELL